MPVDQAVYVNILGLTALVSLAVAYAAWQRRTAAPASQPFIRMMLAIAGYATAAAAEAATTTLTGKIFWSTLEYVGSGSVITFFLIFAAHFTRQKQWLTRRKLAQLWVLPIFNVGLVAANDWHHLVWTRFVFQSDGSHQLIYHHGPGFFWVMVCVYLYTLGGVFLLAKAALRPGVLYRRQSMLALIGAMIPLIGGSAYMLNLTPPGLNITPMSFMLAGLVYSANLFRFRMFDVVPVARDLLIESMSDGVLVLDKQNRIVDINPAAQEMLETTVACIGKSLVESVSQWQEIMHECCDRCQGRLTITQRGCSPRYVELRMTPLRDRAQNFTGQLIVLRDVTEQHHAETKVQQAHDRLQTQLHEIEVLQTQLREQAIRDALTGLFNRRYFEETFPRELARADREDYPLAVVLLDIDYFKNVNDTYGHQGGDRVLQAFGELLRRHSRASDVACRYGGEEFVLVMPKMSLAAAARRTEQICHAWQALPVLYRDQEIYATVSAGIGVFPQDGQTRDTLLQEADQALYTAKADGRNCVRHRVQKLKDPLSLNQTRLGGDH